MTKRFLVPLLAGCGLCLAQLSTMAQDYKTHISKEFAPQKSVNATLVGIYNVSGSVKVQGYNGSKVIIEVDETITGRNAADIEDGKRDFKLNLEQNADTIMAYIAAPWSTKPHPHGWHYNDEDVRYSVQLDFVVKVPNNINVNVSSINNGGIYVDDVYGSLKVNNINGPIDIKNAKGVTDANTINGGITVNYLAVPNDASSYHTINGKVNITFPASLSADLQLKSMNGEFFTDFAEVETLPAQIVKTNSSGERGTIYKMNKNMQVRIGKGGKLFKFETLNGNIYIKKQS